MTETEQLTASRRITDEVTSWPAVEAGIGKRGEFAFTVRDRQIGHLHGDRVVHFGFPKDLGAELRAQGRVGPHPVAPHKTAWAARALHEDEDVRDAIELLRLNYNRLRPDPLEMPVDGLHASTPTPLSFAPSLHVRAFLLRRELGNILVYGAPALAQDAAAIEQLGGVSRQYLNHRHEAMFGPDAIVAPLFVHEDDRASVAEKVPVRGSFSKRHMLDDDFEVIPTPGHTSGATAYLWDSGSHRFLFTGDSIYLNEGEWAAAVLDSSDRAAYLESLELIRELDFDVLAPWAASAGGPAYALTSRDDAQRRIDALIERTRQGAER